MKASGYILIVEDEADLAELVAFNLRKEGHAVQIVHSGAKAVAKAIENPPALILLDLNLPDLSGLDVCRRLREDPGTKKVPIVMLTARGEEDSRVKGFEAGADDYVSKPFSPRELILRIAAVLRRAMPASAQGGDVLTVGEMVIDVPRHEVRVQGEPVSLTALEFRLLLDLASRRGRVQSRDALLDRVWGYSSGIETRTVDTHVKRLREKLGSGAEHIETIRGVGYRIRERLEPSE